MQLLIMAIYSYYSINVITQYQVVKFSMRARYAFCFSPTRGTMREIIVRLESNFFLKNMFLCLQTDLRDCDAFLFLMDLFLTPRHIRLGLTIFCHLTAFDFSTNQRAAKKHPVISFDFLVQRNGIKCNEICLFSSHSTSHRKEKIQTFRIEGSR